jgi:hypothetical protein
MMRQRRQQEGGGGDAPAKAANATARIGHPAVRGSGRKLKCALATLLVGALVVVVLLGAVPPLATLHWTRHFAYHCHPHDHAPNGTPRHPV